MKTFSRGDSTSRGTVTAIASDHQRRRLHTASAQALRIDFVRIGAGMVSGTLEPYIAPDCECQVSTTFTGNVLGDTIRGTFITNGRQGGNRDGMWMMTRRAR